MAAGGALQRLAGIGVDALRKRRGRKARSAEGRRSGQEFPARDRVFGVIMSLLIGGEPLVAAFCRICKDGIFEGDLCRLRAAFEFKQASLSQ